MNNLGAIVNNVTQNTASNWISNYILYPFDSTSNRDYWYPKVTNTNFSAITDSLKNMTQTFNGCPGPSGYTCQSGADCPRPIFTVLGETLADPTFKSPNSVVLLITASNANDYPLADDVQDFAQILRATVGWIYMR